ncbi:hypothetical protein [Nocardia asteroides]
MTSEFERALDDARRRENADTTARSDLHTQAARAAEQSYQRVLEIGREAFHTLSRAGCQECALVEDFRNHKRADNIGILIGVDYAAEGPDDYLFVCRDGRFLAGGISAQKIQANQRWFSNSDKPRLIDGRPVLTVSSSSWVGVRVSTPDDSRRPVFHPASTSSSYSVRRTLDSEELMAWGFGFYQQRPFLDDIAARVARTVADHTG